MAKVKIPIDYVAIPRVTYDLLQIANNDYNRQFEDLRNLIKAEYLKAKERGYGQYIELDVLVNFLGMEEEEWAKKQ